MQTKFKKSKIFSQIVGLCLVGNMAVVTLNAAELPSPLTLQAALVHSMEHPNVIIARANQQKGLASQQLTAADDDIKLILNGRLQWIGPSHIAPNQDQDDHKISLNAEKLLLDFGKQKYKDRQAAAHLLAADELLGQSELESRLDIMQRFFAVLLADLQFDAENEALAMAFKRISQSREQAEAHKITELELLSAEVEFQSVSNAQKQTELQQRSSRAELAESLNTVHKLPSDLVYPELVDRQRKLPAYADILTLVMMHNPALKAVRQRQAAAQFAVRGARTGQYPTVHAYAEIADYARTEESSDEWKIGLHIQVPLYLGGRKNAEQSIAKAKLAIRNANYRRLESELRTAVLQLWQHITMLNLSVDRALIEWDVSDLYLDDSRARYDSDGSYDLGDAMVNFSRAHANRVRLNFELAIAWQQLNVLSGGKLI